MPRRQPLVCQHLENVSRKLLGEQAALVRERVRGRHGVYALYRGDRLYYVGLATDLSTRIEQHLRDSHADGWDRFSLYLTIGAGHLREIEALVLRIAAPKGNRQRGKFTNSENLGTSFRKRVRERQREALGEYFGSPDCAVRPAKRRTAATSQKAPALARYVSEPMNLRASYQGAEITARVDAAGWIHFHGRRFAAPSTAAEFLLNRPCNGWDFWECERAPGDWVRLTELRGRRRR